jgi:hypothetical protein
MDRSLTTPPSFNDFDHFNGHKHTKFHYEKMIQRSYQVFFY